MEERERTSLRTAWERLDQPARIRAVAMLAVHIVLVVLAFRSLSRRNPTSLRGPKWLWSVVIPASISAIRRDTAWVAPVGPVTYFLLARRRREAVA